MESVFLLYENCRVLEKFGFWSVVIIINLFCVCHNGMYNMNIMSVVFVVTYYYYFIIFTFIFFTVTKFYFI
jgi:hypothetical protein